MGARAVAGLIWIAATANLALRVASANCLGVCRQRARGLNRNRVHRVSTVGPASQFRSWYGIHSRGRNARQSVSGRDVSGFL